jgi:plasmid stabilization system protein ParE
MSRLPFVLLPEARDDLDGAFDWYERRRTGLGDQFAEAVHKTIDLITAFPRIGTVKYRDVRQRLVPRFPYVIVYREVGGTIQIVSVFHTSRDPRTWQSRVDDPDIPGADPDPPLGRT